MGCGAICGDEGAQSVTSISIAITTMQKLLPQLAKPSSLLTMQTYTTFMDMYTQNAKQFHLLPKSPLSKDEQVPEDVLVRWKIVLYGLDNDKQHYAQCLGLQAHESKGHESDMLFSESHRGSTIVHHQCFVQIEKDLDRTLILAEARRKDFQVVLKRIANFFPRMGYTQGINFVVAYLLTLGYSQDDAFWMFAHLSLNRRYMLLGLYEDGFPLCNLLCVLFKNMLKRLDLPLYNHLFEVLMVDISMWCFKWFMTCFIYSFPLEMVHYVWDLIMQLGAFGMVSIAVALTQELAKPLLDKEDICQFSQFLKELSELSVFNGFINMERVIRNSYLIEIVIDDFEGAQQAAGFYADYFRQNCKIFQQHLKKNSGLPRYQENPSKAETLLNNWYDSLLEQRQRFLQKEKLSLLNTGFALPLQSHNKEQERSQIQAQIVFCNKEEESTAPDGRPRYQNTNSSVRSERQFHRYRVSYPIDRINEHLQEQSKSAKSAQSQSNHRSVATPLESRRSSSMMSMNELEQLDKLEQQVNQSRKNVKINNYAVPLKEPKQIKMTKRGPQSLRQTLNVDNGTKGVHKMGMRASNTFTMTGQTVLNIDAYDAVSVSSKNASNKQKDRMKTNQHLTVETKRGCACKIKTEQNKFSSAFDKSSERPSSKGQLSDKDSLYNSVCKHNKSLGQENISDILSISMQNVDTYRERQKAANFMINSHGPTLRQSQSGYVQEVPIREKQKAESEVEVLPFKKDKKQKEGRISHIEISKKNASLKARESGEHQEESLQVVQPFTLERIQTVDRSGGLKSSESCVSSSR